MHQLSKVINPKHIFLLKHSVPEYGQALVFRGYDSAAAEARCVNSTIHRLLGQQYFCPFYIIVLKQAMRRRPKHNERNRKRQVKRQEGAPGVMCAMFSSPGYRRKRRSPPLLFTRTFAFVFGNFAWVCLLEGHIRFRRRKI